MTDLIEICGEQFYENITHFSFKRVFTQIENMRELEQFSQFSKLTSASFTGTNLNDFGLSLLTQCKHIDNLNLQETEITNQGISHLKNLPHLKYLRLKENDQLDNSCIPFLNDCQNLIDLQIHETSINQEGLRELHIPGLKDLTIDVWDNNFDFEFLKEYSLKYPECAILAKGNGEFLNGIFNGNWTS